MRPLANDTDHDYLVVIPTIADPGVLPECVGHVLRCSAGARVHLVLSVNPVDESAAEHALALVAAKWDHAPAEVRESCTITIANADGPLGFAGAVNAGLSVVKAFPPLTVILNDDVRVTHGWLLGMRGAVETQEVLVWGEPQPRQPRPVDGYGKIGLVGPCSDNVAGAQAILPTVPPQDRQALAQMMATDTDAYAAAHRRQNPGQYLTCDFLSGFCLGITRECLQALLPRVYNEDLASLQAGRAVELKMELFDPRFGIGGFEDNDLAVRAEMAGWRCVIAGDTFVHHQGHQAMDRHFPGQKRGLANRLIYLEKWREHTQRPQKVVAAMRIGLRFAHDVLLWQHSLNRIAEMIDGLSVVITANPLEVCKAWDWQQIAGQLDEGTTKALRKCAGAKAEDVERVFTAWCKAQIGGKPVICKVWQGTPNERDERNEAAGLAQEELGADWIWSIDHDEIVEPRITPEIVQRLIHHPDPLVRAWDFGWLNHWDSPRLVRIDSPWGDGGAYTSSMRGFRLWRVYPEGRKIMAGTEGGLHCGNCPDHGPLAKRVSGVRFRHFGYLRQPDRAQKASHYREIDPDPNAALTGGGYGHLVAEENMVLHPYVPRNGVGFSMLAYDEEDPCDVARWLDDLHGLADRAVLVWTGPEEPNERWRSMLELFGADWLHHPTTDNLAAARNTGLDALRGDERIGWFFTMDPDETAEEPFAFGLALRRQAECSDVYCWQMKIRNHRKGAPATTSEAIRMVRLEDQNSMRYGGRVHETFQQSIVELQKRGARGLIRPSKMVAHNLGLLGDVAEVEFKLRRYQRMLLQELGDNPENPAAWVSLGLQYENDGALPQARTCFEYALALSEQGYLPWLELGNHYLRLAKAYMRGAVRRISPSHSRASAAVEINRWLDAHIGDFPAVGMATQGEVPAGSIPPLPPLPPSLRDPEPAE